jgi:hypothetical protein
LRVAQVALAAAVAAEAIQQWAAMAVISVAAVVVT